MLLVPLRLLWGLGLEFLWSLVVLVAAVARLLPREVLRLLSW